MVCSARRFAEVAWRSYGKTDNWRNSPRFKLANATRTPDRALDVKMTGFAFLPPNRSASQLRQDLLKAYGIKMARPEPATGKASQMYLSVVGNGWAGSSTRNALLSGGCMLAILDNSTAWDGWSNKLGESYFPFLRPGVHYVPATYDSLAATAKALRRDPATAFRIAQTGLRMAVSFLTRECAIELIRLLSWRYWRWAKRGCTRAFQMDSRLCGGKS